MKEHANPLPCAAEDVVLLENQNRRLGLETGGERLRAFQLRIDVEVERLAVHGEKLAGIIPIVPNHVSTN